MTAVQTTTIDTAAPAGGHIIINGRKAVHIPLETAIERKGETITAVHLMKPLAGDLRGLLLAELLQYKTDAVMKLLPRITVPTITEPEVSNMDTADLVTMAMEVAAFLTPKAVLESLQQ